MQPLSSTNNQYGGTYVSPKDLPDKRGDFAFLLNESILVWKTHGIKVVWIKIPNDRSDLMPILYNAGFENHHCGAGFIMLTKRLLESAVIPHFATHSIGVGGIVINAQNEILSVREKDHIKTRPYNWKFPGGMLDPYEHFEQGVIREVLEETGIITKFENFIGFGHHHKGQFSTSSIYAICRLTPLTHDITIQESEIADAKWFQIEEYLADEKIGKYNQYILRSALRHRGLKSVNLPGYMSSDDDYEVFMS